MNIKSYLSGIAGLGSAMGASLCCVLPAILAATGIGGASVAMALMKIQWPAVLIGIAILVFSYINYFRKRRKCAMDGCRMEGGVVNLILLGISTMVISILFIGFLFPSIVLEILHFID